MQSPSVEGNGRFLTDCNVSRNRFSYSCNCFATIRPPSRKAMSCSLMAAVISEPSAAVFLDSLWFFPLPQAEKTLHCCRSGFWTCHSLKSYAQYSFGILYLVSFLKTGWAYPCPWFVHSLFGPNSQGNSES